MRVAARTTRSPPKASATMNQSIGAWFPRRRSERRGPVVDVVGREGIRASGLLGFRAPDESLRLRGSRRLEGDVYAVVVRVTVNDREAAEKRLQDEIVPRVSQIPGVVAGYWTRADAPDGLSMVVFESEEAARAAAQQVPQMVTEAVTLESVEVRQVVASV
jgi:hypothetical protein